jgi:hypothetical protein
MKKILSLVINKGKEPMYNKEEFDYIIHNLNTGFYEIEFRKKRSPKSIEQLGYYFGCVLVLLCYYYGIIPTGEKVKKEQIDRMDKEMRIKYLKNTFYSVLTKKCHTIYLTISKLNTKQMSEYIDRIMKGEYNEHGWTFPEATKDWQEGDDIHEYIESNKHLFVNIF